MSVVALVATTAGATTGAALLTWRHIRHLNRCIRDLEYEVGIWRYRTQTYGNALTAITLMRRPPNTLEDAQRRAHATLDGLGYLDVEAAG